MLPHAALEFVSLPRPRPLVESSEAPADRSAQLELELAAARAEIARLHASHDRVREDAGRTVAREIADDLRDLLAPIAMSAALLDVQLVDPGARRLLRVMQDAARRGATMVNQIVMFAHGVNEAPVTDPRRLLEDVRRLVAEAFPRSIEVVIEVASDVPPIAGDPSELQDLIVNCCLDARRAMPGGGCLTLRAEKATAADDTAETASGTVTLVAISVSHTGNGTTETMRLLYPARVAPVREDAVADTAPLPRGDGELILVVQDARSVRTITSQLLEAYGYRVLAAGDCAKAVAEFARRRNEIAAVVMDAALPVADGACTMRALQTIDASVKVIAVTGIAGLPAGSDQSAAVAAVLPRPFRTEQLLNVVRQTIGD